MKLYEILNNEEWITNTKIEIDVRLSLLNFNNFNSTNYLFLVRDYIHNLLDSDINTNEDIEIVKKKISDIYIHNVYGLSTYFSALLNLYKLENGFNQQLNNNNPLSANQPIGEYMKSINNISFNINKITEEKMMLLNKIEDFINKNIYRELEQYCIIYYN